MGIFANLWRNYINNYNDIIYKHHQKTDYPKRLILYLGCRFFPYFKNLKLLELGCGKGEYLSIFKNLEIEIYGLDKEKFDNNLNMAQCDFENHNFPSPDNYFDIVFSKSTIEHVYNTDNFLSECYRVLKPNGKIIILTPDWESQHKDFYHDYTHVKPFTYRGLRDVLLIHNFKNVKVEKFYQLPILWKYPQLKILTKLTTLLPNSWKWKDKEERIHNVWIRFSKELMLLGVGEKPNKQLEQINQDLISIRIGEKEYD